MEKGEVKLFGICLSLPVLRIKLALRIERVKFKFLEVYVSNKSNLLLEYNLVHKKVPVLVHNGILIAESAASLKYIKDTWKNNPIWPEDPYRTAIARFWCAFGEDKRDFHYFLHGESFLRFSDHQRQPATWRQVAPQVSSAAQKGE